MRLRLKYGPGTTAGESQKKWDLLRGKSTEKKHGAAEKQPGYRASWCEGAALRPRWEGSMNHRQRTPLLPAIFGNIAFSSAALVNGFRTPFLGARHRSHPSFRQPVLLAP